MGLFDIFKSLNDEEVKFLKFISGKKTSIAFSPRWEALEGINPNKTIEKLLKGYYIIIKNDIFYLTKLGENTLKQKRVLFMSERELAGDNYKELSNSEYTQLKVFNLLDEYCILKKQGLTHNDILWSLYNTAQMNCILQKDYFMAGIAYNRMHSILYKEKKYNESLNFFLIALYLFALDIPLKNDSIDLYERHIKKHTPELLKLINKSNTSQESLKNILISNIELLLPPSLFKEKIINQLIFKLNEYINKK